MNGGSGFPAAIKVAIEQPARGWKAAPTVPIIIRAINEIKCLSDGIGSPHIIGKIFQKKRTFCSQNALLKNHLI